MKSTTFMLVWEKLKKYIKKNINFLFSVHPNFGIEEIHLPPFSFFSFSGYVGGTRISRWDIFSATAIHIISFLMFLSGGNDGEMFYSQGVYFFMALRGNFTELS